MYHVGERIPDCTGDQQRKQRLFGCTAANILSGLCALLISLRRGIADLLAGLDRCVPNCVARLYTCRPHLSGPAADRLRSSCDATLRFVPDLARLIANPIIAHSRPCTLLRMAPCHLSAKRLSGENTPTRPITLGNA